MIDRTNGLELGRRAVHLARTEQLTLLAAGVAYYAFVSLVPLMLLALGIAASIGGDALAMRVSAAASDVLTPSAQQLLADSIADETGQRSATIVGAFGLLWGGSRVFRGLDRAFSEIYGTAASKTLVRTFWDAFIVALAITIGLLALGGLELLVVLVPGIGVSVVGPVLVILGLIVAFLPLYLIFPDVDIGLREAIPGTILAAVGWFALARLFTVYAGIAGNYAFYGAFGAVLLVLAWLYIAAILVIFGAVLNAVLAGRDADRQLQSPGPRQFSTEAMTDDATGTDDGVTEADADDVSADAGSANRVSARTADRAQDPEALREEIERLRDRLESFEDDVERRTVQKESLEAELKRYVRARARSGHAHGWGPYLVLLYGTAMAIAAFYFLSGGWAILAMFVVWTSTLGVYVLMLLVGAGVSVLGVPGRIRNAIGERRS